MERARRILELCYMTGCITCDSGSELDFRYHRCIQNSRMPMEGFDAVPSEDVCLGDTNFG
jgi:hypothetical protein